MNHHIAKDLSDFIQKSPSPYQTVDTIRCKLLSENFHELKETEKWHLESGKNYFITRNSSSLIAFSIPPSTIGKLHIIAGHSDSPSFKIKENPELNADDKYIRLNVEGYGGMLCAPWFDRPLSVAGRIVIKSKNGHFKSISVNIDRDLVLIPNVAIHMNREANKGQTYNLQKDMLPLFSCTGSGISFWDEVAASANVQKEEILGHDLFLYNRQTPSVWGANHEFLSAPRLDDLQCVFAALQGFLSGTRKKHLSVISILDNEEVGSSTRQGAASTFLSDTLERIFSCLEFTREEYLMHIADGFMLSADNAHAVHPNHTDLTDPTNRPVLNGGIVLKFNAGQKYCTDGLSAAMFRDLCRNAGVPVQTFTNRSDMAGGSTLGNISGTKVPLATADIGLPQLAMHSPYETAGIKDTEYLIQAAAYFFS